MAAKYIREATITYRRTDAVAPRVFSSASVADVFRNLIPDGPQEHFVALALDNKNHVIGSFVAGIGTHSSAVVDPSAVFRFALLAGGSRVILAHNHPSGDPTPSEDDTAITGRLCDAGRLLGIVVLDHVILGDRRVFSYLDAGMMPTS